VGTRAAKASRVDTYPYLVALFKALPHAGIADDYEALLPWRLTPTVDCSAGSLHNEPCSEGPILQGSLTAVLHLERMTIIDAIESPPDRHQVIGGSVPMC